MALPLLQSGGGGGGGSSPVTSVFTRTGAVVAATNDYAFSQISGSLATSQLPNLFPTAGVGFFWAGTGPSYPITNSNSTVVTVANQVRVVQTIVPYGITVRKITIGVVALNAAQTGTVGVYDSSGNRLIDSGTFSLAAVATLTNTLGSPVTLAPGVYYIAYSQTDATTAKIQTLLNPAIIQPVFTNNVPRMGTAANSVSGGVMPATLGVVTAASNFIPLVLFET